MKLHRFNYVKSHITGRKILDPHCIYCGSYGDFQLVELWGECKERP